MTAVKNGVQAVKKTQRIGANIKQNHYSLTFKDFPLAH